MATATAERPRQATNTTRGTNTVLDDSIKETESKRRTLVSNAATVLGVNPSQVCNLLRNVWTTSKGSEPLSDQEMFQGISMIARYELDPIAKEIYVTRAKDGRLMTVIGFDGWIKILDRTDHYDGYEQDVHETDKGEVDWIETRIYSKTRSKPAVYKAYMKEYRKLSGFIAEKIPIHMLGIFSLRHAARRFTPLGGWVVTEEEAQFMATGDIAAAAGTSGPKVSDQLDDIANALMKPVLQQPPESQPADEPVSLDQAFATFQTLLLSAVSVTDAQAVLAEFLKNSDSYPDEMIEQAKRLCAMHEEKIKGSRGAKSNKQSQLLDTSETAQSAGK